MRIYTLMMSLLIVALAAAGCSQPEPVRAEYEPADCEEAEASVEEEQAEQAEQQAVDEEAEADRWKEPEADDEAVTVALEEVEEPEQAGDEGGDAVEEAGDEETSAEPAAAGHAGVVNVNDASINQLMELPGVGPALAARIVEFRKQRRFEKPDHLLRVRGIGQAKFAKLAPMLAVDGPTTLAK